MTAADTPRPRVYPGLLLLAMIALGWALARYAPVWRFGAPWVDAAAWILTVAGIAVIVAAIVQFHRTDTTIDPTRPGDASGLMTDGVFRWTRNPIYLGMVAVLLGFVLKMGGLSAALVVPLFMVLIGRWQIRAEEQALARLFGNEWQAYRQRTRRWL